MNKPPIGVEPAWYVLPERIKELSDCISRYSEHEDIGRNKEVTQKIREWATEIICQCDAIDKLQDVKNGNDTTQNDFFDRFARFIEAYREERERLTRNAQTNEQKRNTSQDERSTET